MDFFSFKTIKIAIALLVATTLSACGGSSADSNNNTPITPIDNAPTSFNFLSINTSASKVKTFNFVWQASEHATSYTVCLRDDSQADNCQVMLANLATTETELVLNEHILNENLEFFVIASNSVGKTASNERSIAADDLIASIGYVKASNTDEGDAFGFSVGLSANGSTLVVGAPGESANAIGIDGDQTNNLADFAGAVYIFENNAGIWQQAAYLKASNTQRQDNFGFSVSVSGDGNTIAVGSVFEDSGASGANGSQTDNTALSAGAVYVFSRNNGTWQQQAYLKASNTDTGDLFGFSSALSDNGNVLAVGAIIEGSSATGTNGDQASNSSPRSGAVYLFERSNRDWHQQAYLKASNTEPDDRFGWAVALSGDGNRLAVSAPDEASNATGVNGDQSNNLADLSGAVYIFDRANNTWQQSAYLKASNTDASDNFGGALSLSQNGRTLAVGAEFEASVSTSHNNNAGALVGAVYVFVESGGSWSQQGYLKASNAEDGDRFGDTVSISADGHAIAIGAPGESSNAKGLGGEQSNNSTRSAGAAYLFRRTDGGWEQASYIKASNTDAADIFGRAITLSADASTLVVGASAEQSSSSGIGGNQSNNNAVNSGAVYVY